MSIAIFGGSFNPPHIGHTNAAIAVFETLPADRLIIIPSFLPPHKEQAKSSPSAMSRLEMTSLAFGNMPKVEVSDIEINRGGKSFTVDTLEEIKRTNPNDELMLLMGADMILSFEKWRDFNRILELSTLVVFPRKGGEEAQISDKCKYFEMEFGAKIKTIDYQPIEISSTELRTELQKRSGVDKLNDSVYAYIIKNRYYKAKPNLEWLRKKSCEYLKPTRIPHVIGCAQEAIALAKRWGEDPDLAEEAGLLHDITKKLTTEEQLKLCDKYGIILDTNEKNNYKLFHAKTGAAFAQDVFGISDEVYSSIWWHTTGRENMTLLDKIIYLADYIEPNRDFEGVDKIRKLAYENLDDALILGLRMSINNLKERGINPHKNTQKALEWLVRNR